MTSAHTRFQLLLYHSNSLCIINTMAYIYLLSNNEQLTHFERKNGFFADAKSGAFFYERT